MIGVTLARKTPHTRPVTASFIDPRILRRYADIPEIPPATAAIAVRVTVAIRVDIHVTIFVIVERPLVAPRLRVQSKTFAVWFVCRRVVLALFTELVVVAVGIHVLVGR